MTPSVATPRGGARGRGKFRHWFLLGISLAPAAGAAPRPVTFTQDIAPIIFEHCAGCHRPGQPTPFPLLTYSDVRRRAKQIVEVTGQGFMPPWLPEAGHAPLAHERRLSADQIARLRDWYLADTPEGPAAALPPLPQWPADWQLGPPDLVLRLPRAYPLVADGPDVYRNFVLPSPLRETRHFRALEFHPGPGGIVHHAFVRVDRRGEAQKLEGTEATPGFGGMKLPAGVEAAGGYFLGWQPGKTPTAEPPGYGWTLEPGQNLLIMAHLKPSGKPTDFTPELGLYFAPAPPTNATVLFTLGSLSLAIPPGETNYLVTDEFLLPAPVDLLSVLPHAHYLARELEGSVVRPDGTGEILIRIPDWDFNWQGDYRFAPPIHLPAGSRLRMRYRYDNSAANPRNPHSPPREVVYGPQSTDEMAELWFQAHVTDAAAAAAMKKAFDAKQDQLVMDFIHFRVAHFPTNAEARTDLGFFQMRDNDEAAALANFRQAARDDPQADRPHYYIGLILRGQADLAGARAEFETALRLNPTNSRAHGNLGIILLQQGNLRRAERSLREALRLDPADELARQSLDALLKAPKVNP